MNFGGQEGSAARQQQPACQIIEDGDVLAVSLRDWNRQSHHFAVVWLVVWTAGCVALAWKAVTDGDPQAALVCIPMWTSWIYVAGIVLNQWVGRHDIILAPAGLAAERRTVVGSWRRLVPLAEVRGIESRVFKFDAENGATHGIEIRTLGRSITTGTALPTSERDLLAERLDRHRRRLQAAAGVGDDGAVDPGDCRGSVAPTDSRWSIADDLSGLQFIERGRFDMGAVLGLLFLGVFWNGLVGIFLGGLWGLAGAEQQPAGSAWWAWFLFLMPFEALGVALVVALIAAVVEPVRETRWRFDRDAIRSATRRAGFPLGWGRHVPHAGLAAATIRDDLQPRREWYPKAIDDGVPTGTHHGLVLADRTQAEIGTIRGLTLGEARWIKGRLQTAGLIG